MQDFLTKQREAFALVTKAPGRRDLKKTVIEDLKNQIDHVFGQDQFEMNVFFGQPGMGKRSSVHAAIDESLFADSIFYLEIDAEFTRTEYLLLNKIFNLIKAEDPFFNQMKKISTGDGKKNTKKSENKRVLDLSIRKDHAANFLNKEFTFDEDLEDNEIEENNKNEKKYLEFSDNEEELEQGTFKQLDEQDALSMYSTLHEYFSFFRIILYIRNASIFTRTKRQSFFYNILEMTRKQGSKGLIIFESQNLNFLESLEKRNASRMNPRKFIFGDFSLEMEFLEIVRKTLEKTCPGNVYNESIVDFLNLPIILQELSLFTYRDFSLSQMLGIIASFFRQLTAEDLKYIHNIRLKTLTLKNNDNLLKLLKKLRLADEELHGDYKVATFDKNLCETEQIILMIINDYYILNNHKGPPLIKVKNIENNIASLIKSNDQKAYQMTRELLHMSIENLQRIGLIKLSKKRLNLETVITADIDPNFERHLLKYKKDNSYMKMPALEILDTK